MTDEHDKLERLVDSLVRVQPPRRAPASLEARVLARLAEHQAPMSWWRRGFTSWPLAARGAFLIASYGFVRLALAGFGSVSEFVGSGGSGWNREVLGAIGSRSRVRHRFHRLLRIAGHSANVAVWRGGVRVWLYALLFGLGTLAYRTLYVER